MGAVLPELKALRGSEACVFGAAAKMFSDDVVWVEWNSLGSFSDDVATGRMPVISCNTSPALPTLSVKSARVSARALLNYEIGRASCRERV